MTLISISMVVRILHTHTVFLFSLSLSRQFPFTQTMFLKSSFYFRFFVLFTVVLFRHFLSFFSGHNRIWLEFFILQNQHNFNIFVYFVFKRIDRNFVRSISGVLMQPWSVYYVKFDSDVLHFFLFLLTYLYWSN